MAGETAYPTKAFVVGRVRGFACRALVEHPVQPVSFLQKRKKEKL
jgi:hypothetical protein